jgi:pentatricopeptide repeat protein
MRARNIHPTLASYTILIQLHVNKRHDVETGLRLFSEMKAQGIVPGNLLSLSFQALQNIYLLI